MTSTGENGVVIGFDGSQDSVFALEWAMTEAQLRDVHLQLCHVSGPYPTTAIAELTAIARGVLDQGSRHAKRQELTVVPKLARGGAARQLIEISADAELLVLGARGTGGFRGLRVGSVAAQVARHARCPVVIVHARATDHDERSRRIVVGYDGSKTSDAAIGFAFREATLHDMSVHVIQAWDTFSVLTAAYVPEDELDQLRVDAERGLAAASRGHVDAHPDIEASFELVHSTPGPALSQASVDAELLIVGSRGHGGFRTLMLGSTSDTVLYHASCPLVIVRPAEVAADQSTADTKREIRT
jgi:nucleotide-binding universal stress UspA family protein